METKLLRKYEQDLIVKAFKEGLIVAMPTDTVFGLACIYHDLAAKERIKEIKGREKVKSLPMMVNGLMMAKEYCVIDDRCAKLMSAFSPGAITYILKRKHDLDPRITDGKDTVALRIPADDLILDVITKLDCPILMTSANLSHHDNLSEYRDVYALFKDKVDVLVMENAKSLVASTIVDVSEGDLKIIRNGMISEKELRDVYAG